MVRTLVSSAWFNKRLEIGGVHAIGSTLAHSLALSHRCSTSNGFASYCKEPNNLLKSVFDAFFWSWNLTRAINNLESTIWLNQTRLDTYIYHWFTKWSLTGLDITTRPHPRNCHQMLVYLAIAWPNVIPHGESPFEWNPMNAFWFETPLDRTQRKVIDLLRQMRQSINDAERPLFTHFIWAFGIAHYFTAVEIRAEHRLTTGDKFLLEG
jgi:hypothetical protein